MKKLFALALLGLSLVGFGSQAQATTAVGVADTDQLINTPSLSALFSNNEDWIQAYLGVSGTSGNFRFGVGGAYKFTVAGTSRLGFHVGPGISLGTTSNEYGSSKFFFTVEGAMGAHATLFDRVLVSVDGGPILSVVDGNANFKMRTFGNMLGASVYYIF